MSEDWKNRQEEEEEEEEEEIDETSYKTAKDAVLFVIDVSKSMLTKPEEPDSKRPDTALSPTAAALKCAYSLMQQRIISNPHDMMGILLFGTKQSKFQEGDQKLSSGGYQYPNCFLLVDLDVPAAADVKQLKRLVEDEELAAEILEANDEEVAMANVLFCVNQIFTTKAPNFSSRRVFLVTDNDYPHVNNRDARNSAAVRAKDLYDLGVTIELFPISHPDRGYTFDRAKFYDDIVYSATPADPDAPEPLVRDIKAANSSSTDGISLLQSLLSSVASRSAPKRSMFSNVPFEIGPALRISVKGYAIMMRQEPKRTTWVYLSPDSEMAQIATMSSSLIAEDNARTIEKVEVRKAFKFGGETISFSEEELAKIKKFDEPVIRIIGFKPMRLLPIWASTKRSTFIYPSEEGYVGSTRVFSALHQKLSKSSRFGLAWYVPRRNATPRLAAVIPGTEHRSEEGEQLMPPGLWVKPLPFADDIRQPPETKLVLAPDNLIDAMRIVIQQLQLPKAVYDPTRYPNPSLQWFYRILQALALDEDLPEQPEDKTLPRHKQIHKRAGGYVVDWGQILESEYAVWQKANPGESVTGGVKIKRSAATALNGAAKSTASKKVKREDADGDADGPADEDIRKAYENDALSKLTVATLKEWLAGKGVRAAGKKADLVDEVTKWFETKMNMT